MSNINITSTSKEEINLYAPEDLFNLRKYTVVPKYSSGTLIAIINGVKIYAP